MRVILAFILGAIVGAAAIWFYDANSPRPSSPGASSIAPSSTGFQDKLRGLNLTTDDIKEELARSGQVVRRKAAQAGQALADATADARITAAIKTKLLGNRDLSAVRVSVNTTAGVVTLSGSVLSVDEISKVVLVALETEGVREVISTLQLKKESKPAP
jgi:hyperosmotically inducible periplasmic protein